MRMSKLRENIRHAELALCIVLAGGALKMRMSDDRVVAEAEPKIAEARRLETYCSLIRFTAQGAHDDLVTPIAPGDTNTTNRDIALRTWNTLAEIDGRALAPCLAPHLADHLRTCAEGDYACVVTNSTIALASFAP
jgi:hypothetical protein